MLLQHIQSIRQKAVQLDAGATSLPLAVPRLYRRSRSHSLLLEKASCMQQVLQAKQAIAALLEVTLTLNLQALRFSAPRPSYL